MKTRLLSFMIVAALSVSSFNVLAQNPEQPSKEKRMKERPTPEQMMERHMLMMEKNLMMDDATAAKFKPLYQEYINAMKECNPKASKEAKKGSLTDAEIEKNIQDRLDAKIKKAEVQKKYFNEFKKILNAKQLVKVFNSGKKNHMKPCMKCGKDMKCGKMMKPGCKQHIAPGQKPAECPMKKNQLEYRI